MAQHHRPAPRTQVDACTALMITDHSLWTPQSQNRLRNRVTPAQLLPFPSLGSKSWLCRVSCSHCLLRADRSPTCILHQEQGLGSDWRMQSTGANRYQHRAHPCSYPHVLPPPVLEFVQGSNKVAACQAAARPESQNLGLGMFCVPGVKIPCQSRVRRDCHHRKNGSNTKEKPTLWPWCTLPSATHLAPMDLLEIQGKQGTPSEDRTVGWR